ncbi:unnamed protein product [marine sediment metagenome]|uniref:Uncharacterized protein n=1 Tax=marine sediment metagenome TaxID=412755 RepID=X1IBJ8_9ZZZZ
MAAVYNISDLKETSDPKGSFSHKLLPGLPPSGDGLAACNNKARIVEKLFSLCLLGN